MIAFDNIIFYTHTFINKIETKTAISIELLSRNIAESTLQKPYLFIILLKYIQEYQRCSSGTYLFDTTDRIGRIGAADITKLKQLSLQIQH